MKQLLWLSFALIFSAQHPPHSIAWFDEPHVAIAKAAGYAKWFNACGPDMIREKIGSREGHNHFVNNPRGTLSTPNMVVAQIERYNKIDSHGHLYGSIIASVRDYIKKRKAGKYAEYHLAFCGHYVSDLSQPLHNMEHDTYNVEHHLATDGIINDEILANLEKIKVYPIKASGRTASRRMGTSKCPGREIGRPIGKFTGTSFMLDVTLCGIIGLALNARNIRYSEYHKIGGEIKFPPPNGRPSRRPFFGRAKNLRWLNGDLWHPQWGNGQG